MRLLLLLLFFFSLSAQEELLVVDSGSAFAEGKSLLFSDPVNVKAAFGELSAKKMEMVVDTEGDHVQFDRLIFDEDVWVQFKDGGYLRCAHAEIAGDELKGKLVGTVENPVTYRNDKRGGVKIQAEKMGMHFAKEERLVIHSLTADRFVRVDFLHDLSMSADCARYERSEKFEGEKAPKYLPGTFFLEGECRITNKHEDTITAKKVCYDSVQRKLFVQAPKGDFRMRKEGKARGILEFTAGTLQWDRFSQKMTLSENIVLNLDEMGALVAKEQVFFYYDEGEEIRKIESQGETVLTLSDPKGRAECQIACYGKVLLDRANGIALLEGPIDDRGQIPPHKQVSFQDTLVKIASDRMQVAYRKNEQDELVPARFILEGNVHLINRLSQEEMGPLQYALADKVEYQLQNRELFLSSSEGKRVLFLDKENNIQMSATALKVKKSTAVQKGYIQGVGDVRFRFAQREAEVMDHFFLFSEASS